MIRLARFAVAVALVPPVALVTAWFGWINTVNNAKCAANARERARYCDAEPLHFDDETCPGCCPEVALAEAVEAAHAPLSWELAKTKAVRDMSLIESAAWLATARDIDGLGAYVEREWVG